MCGLINSAVRRVLRASDLVVDGCRVSALSGPELLGTFARGAVVEGAVQCVSCVRACAKSTRHILYALLRPLQVLLHFLCGSHALCKTGLRAHQSALSKGLQFEKFTVLGVELTGSVRLLVWSCGANDLPKL
jgi:hypothetical protein